MPPQTFPHCRPVLYIMATVHNVNQSSPVDLDAPPLSLTDALDAACCRVAVPRCEYLSVTLLEL